MNSKDDKLPIKQDFLSFEQGGRGSRMEVKDSYQISIPNFNSPAQFREKICEGYTRKIFNTKPNISTINIFFVEWQRGCNGHEKLFVLGGTVQFGVQLQEQSTYTTVKLALNSTQDHFQATHHNILAPHTLSTLKLFLVLQKHFFSCFKKYFFDASFLPFFGTLNSTLKLIFGTLDEFDTQKTHLQYLHLKKKTLFGATPKTLFWHSITSIFVSLKPIFWYSKNCYFCTQNITQSIDPYKKILFWHSKHHFLVRGNQFLMHQKHFLALKNHFVVPKTQAFSIYSKNIIFVFCFLMPETKFLALKKLLMVSTIKKNIFLALQTLIFCALNLILVV